jgi:hypothetical protein
MEPFEGEMPRMLLSELTPALHRQPRREEYRLLRELIADPAQEEGLGASE